MKRCPYKILSIIAIFALVFALVFLAKELKKKEKILEKAVFPGKLPEEGLDILRKYNITCYGYSCYEFNRYNKDYGKMDCWIVLGKWIGDRCLISGRSFAISCLKINDTWKCAESAFSSYEYERDIIKILFWKRNGECCYLVGINESKPYYRCFKSSLLNCTLQLLR